MDIQSECLLVSAVVHLNTNTCMYVQQVWESGAIIPSSFTAAPITYKTLCVPYVKLNVLIRIALHADKSLSLYQQCKERQQHH